MITWTGLIIPLASMAAVIVILSVLVVLLAKRCHDLSRIISAENEYRAAVYQKKTDAVKQTTAQQAERKTSPDDDEEQLVGARRLRWKNQIV